MNMPAKDLQEIRLRILEGLLPHLTRLDIRDEDRMPSMANVLEMYVIKGYPPTSEASTEGGDPTVAAPKKRKYSTRKPKEASPKQSGDNPIPGLQM